MQSSKLPIEVCERIIDYTLPPSFPFGDILFAHLYESVQTLSACALVCRDWVPRSQHHLFCRVELFTSEQAHAFFDAVASSAPIARRVRFLRISPTRPRISTPSVRDDEGLSPPSSPKITKRQSVQPSYYNWIYQPLPFFLLSSQSWKL